MGSEFFYNVILFYTNQCDLTKFDVNPWAFLENHYADLAYGKNVLDQFISTMDDDTTLQQLTQECGLQYAPVVELLKQLKGHINILADTSVRALNLMKCQNIVPLYTNLMYEASCQYSVVGAAWVFSCAVLIAFFGMLCIMFRGAYYPIDYYYYENKNSPEGKSLYGTDSSDISNPSAAAEDVKDEDVPDEPDLDLRKGLSEVDLDLRKGRGVPDDTDLDLRKDRSCIDAVASAGSMMDDVDIYQDVKNVTSHDNGEVVTLDHSDTSGGVITPFDCGGGLGTLADTRGLSNGRSCH